MAVFNWIFNHCRRNWGRPHFQTSLLQFQDILMKNIPRVEFALEIQKTIKVLANLGKNP